MRIACAYIVLTMEIKMIETTEEYQDLIKGGWANSPLREENIGKKLSSIIPYYQIPKLFSAPYFYGNTEEEMISGMKFGKINPVNTHPTPIQTA